MTRLTLEALERRDLLSANLLAESLITSAPPAHLTINLENTMVSGFTINLENTMVSSFSGLERRTSP
jgi:hypothetical protein